MNEPRLTIAIPVYNRPGLVLRALASALAENIEGLDVLVVDNASTDSTWETLQTCDDPRVRLVRNDRNLGLFGNFNRCLELASGTYLRFLCSDDVLVPGSLEREIAVMDAYPDVALLSSSYRMVDPDGRSMGGGADLFPQGVYPGEASIAAVLWCLARHARNPLNYPSGVLLRTRCARAAGAFDETYRMTGDVDLFLRTLRVGDLAILNAPGCQITGHDAMESAQLVSEAHRHREVYRLIGQHRAHFVEGSFDRAVAELAGHAAAAAVRYALVGRWTAARAHLRVARAIDAPWWQISGAAAGQVRRSLVGRRTGRAGVPLPTAQTLVIDPCGDVK